MPKQLVFIHGGETFGTYNEYLAALAEWTFDPFKALKKRWKYSLQEELGEEWEVMLPDMPNKYNAKYIEWQTWFEKVIPHLRDGVVLIGHSLGGIFLAKYLAEHELPVAVRKIILIAAPYDDADSDYSLADFALPTSLERLSAYDVTLYHSEDDPIVPFVDLGKYQRAVPTAQVRALPDRGHFMDEKFPELVEELKAL
jgi:predicted alpha/beta hydrolase family esterase